MMTHLPACMPRGCLVRGWNASWPPSHAPRLRPPLSSSLRHGTPRDCSSLRRLGPSPSRGSPSRKQTHSHGPRASHAPSRSDTAGGVAHEKRDLGGAPAATPASLPMYGHRSVPCRCPCSSPATRMRMCLQASVLPCHLFSWVPGVQAGRPFSAFPPSFQC